MKKTITGISFVFVMLLTLGLQAQNIKLPSPDFSKDMLSALNPGSDLGLSSDVKSKVDNENKSFVNDVVDIMGSSDDDETKKLKINNRKKEHDGILGSAFGSDNALKSYKKDLEKQLKPFKRKYKMASWIF